MWGYPIHITTFIQRLEFYLTIICEYRKLYEKQELLEKNILKFTFVVCSTQWSHPFSFNASNFAKPSITQRSNLWWKSYFCYFIKICIFFGFFFLFFRLWFFFWYMRKVLTFFVESGSLIELKEKIFGFMEIIKYKWMLHRLDTRSVWLRRTISNEKC